MLLISRISIALALLVTVVGVAFPQAAQSAEATLEEDPQYRQALELYRQGKFLDALPLFEKLVEHRPSDIKVREGWAWCMFESAVANSDPEQRKQIRARARTIAVQPKNLPLRQVGGGCADWFS